MSAASLDDLVVLERLEVGPVVVEPRRIRAPYRVVRDGVEASTELVFRYEEDVFEPGHGACENLAALIAAQVALNYGLFCEAIVFRGPYDAHDRRFLDAMARNTAREIAVNKLFEPNPFLIGAAQALQPERRPTYLQARLEFPDPAPSGLQPWTTSRSRVAVLSSGGKESLLSHGLLTELGLEVHPVFVNESGRHWFTALNAYRHFAAQVPRTARVWTNADRVFTWMLRQLPFVRPDFANVRADIYPLRLWTVAVFLFGVMGIVRARGIGRVVIGDEHDTTVRRSSHGITHYAGLYDQSRYFDNALSSFFGRKGWRLAQFSVLRWLSELLVEKTLLERYPDLQTLQTSCHATHVEGGRALPCGRCEKCRRVVGMLSALGADPSRCGYSREQVDQALAALAATELHQESAGVEQMRWLLAERGILGRSEDLRPRPEVLKLRIDPERSPLDGLPVELRPPLVEILLDHADGAVARHGRVWVEVNPLDDQALAAPYPFEGSRDARTRRRGRRRPGPRPYLLGELTWPDAEDRLREVDVALLPVGALEQHGPHLPLDTDAWDADELARRVAEACHDPKPLVLPLIPYGVSYHHEDFAGTVSVSNEALAKMVYDVGMSIARHGITKLVIVNGHGGNTATLQFAAQKINRDARIFTCVDTGETSDTDLDALIDTTNDVHAGEIETSTALATRPHLVRMDRAEAAVPRFSSDYLNFSHKRSVEWYAKTSRLSSTGVLGDPTRATAEKGERMWQAMVANLVELVEYLKGTPLDEIYERRY